MISGVIFKRRLRYRLHIIKELLSLIIDFWVSLYLIIPGLFLAVSTYIQLLHALPNWYLPDFHNLWPIIFTFIIIIGVPRSYLARADLIHVFHREPDFRKILIYGQIISVILKSIPILLFLILAYPFYRHIQNISLNAWLWLSLWVLVIKAAVLIIKWHLSIRLSPWVYKGTLLIIGLAFSYSWVNIAAPFLMNIISYLWLIIDIILWLVVLTIIRRLMPVKNWDVVTAAEENYDISMMRLFLGYGAHVQVGGRVGKARWGRSRLGIDFNKKYTYTYFFVKYFLRKTSLWMLCGQFYFLAGLLLVQSVSFEFKLIFMIGTLVLMAFMLQMVWQEHSQDLFLRMLPIQWEDLQQGIVRALRLLLVPLSILFVLVPISGTGTFIQGITGAGVILASTLGISGYIGLRTSVLFNYDQNQDDMA